MTFNEMFNALVAIVYSTLGSLIANWLYRKLTKKDDKK